MTYIKKRKRDPAQDVMLANRPPLKPVPKVTCAECGKQMLRLTHTHLEKYHDGMLIDDYIKKHGMAAARPQIDGITYEWMTGGPKNTALNDETHLLIMTLAEKGYPKSTIAKTVGISIITLQNWLRWGAPDSVDKHGNRIHKDMYYKFYQDYQKAEALSEIQAVDALRDAGRSDWRAAVEFLARRFPENWRPESKHTVEIDGQVDIVHSRDLDIEKLLEDPETAELACTLLEKLSMGDRLLIEGEATEVVDIEGDDDES
jgi:transposase-like protein